MAIIGPRLSLLPPNPDLKGPASPFLSSPFEMPMMKLPRLEKPSFLAPIKPWCKIDGAKDYIILK